MRADSPLIGNIRRALAERRLSARRASISAGLGSDGVRNILRGLTKSPPPSTLQAISRVTGIPVDALTGEAPWPAGAPSPPPPPEPSRRPDRGARRLGEYVLTRAEWRDVPGGRTAVDWWTIPRAALGDRADADLVIVRSPHDYGSDVRRGDRLLVDVSAEATAHSPPGVFLRWDGLGHMLERLEAVSPTEAYDGKIVHEIEDLQIVGRVVGVWRVS